MATHAGSEGIVKITDKRVAEVKSWSLEEVCDTVDASVIGTQWRKNQATIRSWSGSIDAFWDDTEDIEGEGKLKIGSTIDLKLYPEGIGDTKWFFSGSAIITGISRQASFDGLVESSFTFIGNDKLIEHKQVQEVVPQQNQPNEVEQQGAQQPAVGGEGEHHA